MDDIDGIEARRLLNELRDHETRRRHLGELLPMGTVDVGRLDDEALLKQIVRMRRGGFRRDSVSNDLVEHFARTTGNTYEGARTMIEADQRYGTYTFVRGSAPDDGRKKASPSRIKELREAGHSPKPSFIKVKSGEEGFLKPTDKEWAKYGQDIKQAEEAGWLDFDSAGYMIDTRLRLLDGSSNPGFKRRYVSDVDLALVLSREGAGTSTCNEATYAAVQRANSWYYNQRCSCTHGAFAHWATKTKSDHELKQALTSSHLAQKKYAQYNLSASQIGRSALLRPSQKITPEQLRNATFKLIDADPLIAFIGGRIFRTYVDRLHLDLIALKLRGDHLSLGQSG